MLSILAESPYNLHCTQSIFFLFIANLFVKHNCTWLPSWNPSNCPIPQNQRWRHLSIYSAVYWCMCVCVLFLCKTLRNKNKIKITYQTRFVQAASSYIVCVCRIWVRAPRWARNLFSHNSSNHIDEVGIMLGWSKMCTRRGATPTKTSRKITSYINLWVFGSHTE